MRYNRVVTSDRFDRRLGQVVCCGGAPVVLACAVLALRRAEATPAELLIGLLAAAALSVGLVVLGIVAGPRPPASS